MTIHPKAAQRTARVGGAEVTFHDTGSPGSPVVLLHGTGGSAERHFGTLFPMLAARHRVIAVDFAAAPDGEPLTMDRLVRQVSGVLDEAAPAAPVSLVGYSLGAVVAAATAARHPDRVTDLVLVAGWITTDAQQLLRNTIWRELRRGDSRALRDFMVYTTYGAPYLADKSGPEMEELAARMVLDEDRDAQMELNRTVDISSVVTGVRARTLVIGGTHDQMVPPRHSESLFGAIPGARLARIDSGHAVVAERPAELFSLIDGFVARRIPDPPGTVLASPRI